MKIVAIICVRNEIVYLREIIPYLKDEEIEVILVDNDSSDGTLRELSGERYTNILRVERLPFCGTYDQTAQLEMKARLVETADADWVIHQDADEILQSGTTWGGLRRNIELADSMGVNVINFSELVMLPVDPEIDDFLSNNRNYYFYEPAQLQLMRAWKRESGLTNVRSGGHRLEGSVNVFPERMLLKHFIVRTQRHANDKYVGRRFPERETRVGWHIDRVGLTEEQLRIPTIAPWLHRLSDPRETPSELPPSTRLHYWQWPREGST